MFLFSIIDNNRFHSLAIKYSIAWPQKYSKDSYLTVGLHMVIAIVVK